MAMLVSEYLDDHPPRVYLRLPSPRDLLLSVRRLSAEPARVHPCLGRRFLRDNDGKALGEAPRIGVAQGFWRIGV
jgi:hypothetical protein